MMKKNDPAAAGDQIEGQINIFEYMEDIKLNKTIIMFGKEWNPLSVKPEGITEYDHLEVLGEYKFNNQNRWSLCQAFFDGNKVIALDVPWDIPHPKWKYWRLKEKIYPVEVKGLMDDAYCPKCGYCFNEIKELDCKICPVCKTRVDWKPWHDRNDEEINN